MKSRLFRLATLLFVGLALSGAMVRPVRGNDIYDQIAPATVMFYDVVVDVQNNLAYQSVGSGVLVDADKKLVVTAEHVVHRTIRDGSFKTTAMFPVLDKSGKVNTNAIVYRKKRQNLAIAGDIVYFDRAKDLALIRLARVPDGVKAVALSAGNAEPGDAVHVVGNSTFFDGGAFDYCRGTVRNQFYYNTPRVVVAGNPFRDYVFFTLCHDVPTNQGDSGGPIVDGTKQLLGIVSQGTTGSGDTVQVVDKSVHVREIRRALDGIQQPAGNTLELTASVDRLGFDSFFLPVKQGGKMSAVLKGQGTTDLDLFVKDIDNFRNAPFGIKTYRDYASPVESTGPTDQEQGALVPTWTGVALVQVQNVGGQNGNNGNEYSLVVNWSDRVSAPFTFIRQLGARGSDTFKLPYEAGKGKARATVRGDGETALEIEVLDPGGASIAKGQVITGYHDLRSLTWDPAVSGTYSVRIRNVGGVGTEYVFTTD